MLGTQEHWDCAYKAELAEFRASGGADAGEVWFGEDTQAKMVAFVGEQTEAREPPGGAAGRAGWRVLDLGCGNGALCVALARAGFVQLLGVDYVAASIALSREVAAAGGVACARFQEDDVLRSALPAAAFDLVVDKGTFDAVGLRADGEQARSLYLDAVARLLPPGGLLVLTSASAGTHGAPPGIALTLPPRLQQHRRRAALRVHRGRLLRGGGPRAHLPGLQIWRGGGHAGVHARLCADVNGGCAAAEGVQELHLCCEICVRVLIIWLFAMLVCPSRLPCLPLPPPGPAAAKRPTSACPCPSRPPWRVWASGSPAPRRG